MWARFRTEHLKIPQNLKQMVSTKIVHTSGTVLDFFRENVQKYIWTMFPYTVKYTESEYDIQNNDLLYKIDQQWQNTFDFSTFLENFEKVQNVQICILYFV